VGHTPGDKGQNAGILLMAIFKRFLPVLVLPLLAACDPNGSFKGATVVNGCSAAIEVRLSSSSSFQGSTEGRRYSVGPHSKRSVPNAFASPDQKPFSALVVGSSGTKTVLTVPNVGDPVTVTIPSSAC